MLQTLISISIDIKRKRHFKDLFLKSVEPVYHFVSIALKSILQKENNSIHSRDCLHTCKITAKLVPHTRSREVLRFKDMAHVLHYICGGQSQNLPKIMSKWRKCVIGSITVTLRFDPSNIHFCLHFLDLLLVLRLNQPK